MRVLFSLTYYWPYVSGLTLIVKRLAEAMVLSGWQATVICMQHDSRLAKREVVEGVQVVRFRPDFAVSRGYFSLAWIWQSWRLVNENDVVMVNLPQVEGVVPAIWSKLLGKRLVANYLAEVVLRGGWVDKLVEGGLRIVNWMVLMMADKVVTYSEEYAGFASELANWKRKTVWIYPPVPEPMVDLAFKKQLKEKLGRTKGVVRIGVAARLAEDKGFEFLFEAIPMIQAEVGRKRVEVVIAGPTELVGESRYRGSVIDKWLRVYKEEIIFLGLIPPEKMGAFYSIIDVLVYPSILEAFGLAQVEAMMCGVPVVATNLPGASVPIKRTGMGVLVRSRNAQELAGGIAKALRMKALASKSRLAKKAFAVAKTVDAYKTLLQQV